MAAIKTHKKYAKIFWRKTPKEMKKEKSTK
jgi:hypothetical protein